MKVSWALAATLVGSVLANAEAEPNAESIQLDKRAFIAVTGATGASYPRLEIRTLAKNTDQYNLYLLAMQKFMAMSQSDPMSYFQIAAIHGRPYVEWNNVPGVRTTGGYCPHVSNMFLPWHRPYLALFEQQLLVCAQQVVNSFPASSRTRWSNALVGLRMPYWDWAQVYTAGDCDVPALIRDQTVSVTTPTGQQTIANPLYSYHFNPAGAQMGGDPYSSWVYTWRRPVLPASTARSNNNEFCSTMNNNRISLRNRVYNLFTQTTLYRLFSTEATGGNSGNPESHDSIESVHDQIHIIAGGPTGGHMYYLDYSAFDPVFWLHHTNIDRLGAMFQVINPNSFVVSGAQTQNNFQWNAGDVKNWYTPLKPFTSDTTGDFWFPQTSRSTEVFNYHYPETPTSATASSVKSTINSLYGPSSPGNPSKRRSITARTGSGYALQQGDYDYVSHVVTDKFAVGGSYYINFYLGCGSNSTSNSTSMGYNSTSMGYNTTSVDYVGLNAVLAPYDKVDQVTYVSGAVPLTSAIQAKYASGELAGLDQNTVNAYLTKCLSWEVVKGGGEIIPAGSVGSLTIAVGSREVTGCATADTFPTYGELQFHPDVTANKPGGYTGSNPLIPSGGSDTCGPTIEYEYVDEDGQFLYSSMGSKL